MINKKIINIRPSEKLMKEFYGHNIEKYEKNIKLIKRFGFKNGNKIK